MLHSHVASRKLLFLYLLAAPGLGLLGLGCASAPKPFEPPDQPPDQPATESPSLVEPNTWRYALVIDASSSASALQIFEWQPGHDGRLPQIEAAPRNRTAGGDDWTMRVQPGLGSFADRPTAAAASLEPLIEYALNRIGDGPETLARASVLVRATAGLRLLSEAAQGEILGAVEEYLGALSFGSTSIRVISGEEEGIFGWLSANYVLGHLEHGGRFPTVGVLDLGGASTQITFQPLDLPEPFIRTVTLGSRTYSLYTKSYLGLGQDESRKRVGSPACFLIGYPTPNGPGTGDFDACRGAVRDDLEAPCSEDSRPCPLLASYQPPLYGDFIAVSAYAYTADFFGLREHLRPEALAAAGKAYCARDWQAWVAKEPDVAEDPFLPKYCYSAAHSVALLVDGFGFPADTDRITAPLRIQGSPIGWTLGALLYELAGPQAKIASQTAPAARKRAWSQASDN